MKMKIEKGWLVLAAEIVAALLGILNNQSDKDKEESK